MKLTITRSKVGIMKRRRMRWICQLTGKHRRWIRPPFYGREWLGYECSRCGKYPVGLRAEVGRLRRGVEES